MSSVSKIDFISDLPTELSQLVLSKLSIPELAICELVSKTWKNQAENDALWKANFSHIFGAEIISKMTARAYFGVNVPVNTKEKLIEKITNFFELHKKNHDPVIAMHYQSGSNPDCTWDYVLRSDRKGFDQVVYLNVCSKDRKVNFFTLPELNIIGFGEADLSKNAVPEKSAFTWPNEKKYYGVVERRENCEFELTNEIARKSNMDSSFMSWDYF